MLTPDELANKKFEKAAFGYKPEEVDGFLNEVAAEFSRCYAEKEDAEEKLEVLADKLEEYRASEDSLRTVLIGAQKLGDSIIRDSKGKAEVIIAEAEQRAKQIDSDTEKHIGVQREELDRIRRETADFKKHLLAIYKQHLELISAMPEPEPQRMSEPAADEAPEAGFAPEEPQEIEPPAEPEISFDEVTMAETKEISFPVQE